jgi:hypothetical protein
MEIKFRQNASDLLVALDHVQQRLRGRSLRQGFWHAVAAGVLVGLLLLMKSGGYPAWLWLLVCLVLLAQAVWIVKWMRNGITPASNMPDGDHVLNLVPAGISHSMPEGHVEFYVWPEITALEITVSHLYFHLGQGAALIVPRAAMVDASGERSPLLEEEARRLWAAHPGNEGKTLPDLPPLPELPFYQALTNLGTAARLACFLKFEPGDFRASWGALGLLLLIEAGWSGVIDYIEAQPMPLFNPDGAALYGVSVLLFFAWALAVNGLMARRATLLRLMVMAESTVLFISLVYMPVYLELEQHPSASGWPELIVASGAIVWMVVALTRIVRRLYGKGYVAALILGGSLVLFSMTLFELYPGDSIYVSAANPQPARADAQHPARDAVKPGAAKPAPGEDDDRDNPADDDDDEDDDEDDQPPPSAQLDVEGIYYRQPELIRHELDGVKQRRPGETALYFVGFAGDASEHEFGNEVRYARGLLDRRFNTAGRSLLLINSYDTVNDIPLANTHNMESVLQGLAGRMDRQNDVLFVFLSSHGAQDHRLGVSFYPLEMNDLKAEKLKEMLDKSGIRNRVIVVSACYSGGFLDVLKDDNTLVLTASRRDHVAYGCGDITEYTYFGEAYFVNALEHNNSFIGAFDEARKRIAEREKSEGMDASNPQIHVGRNIGKVLQRLKVVPAGLKGIKPRPAQEEDNQQKCPENCPGDPG